MKKKLFSSKFNLAIIILLFFLMSLACKPEEGSLIASPSEGVEIITSEAVNDTAQIKSSGLIFKAKGNWGAGVLFDINIENSSSKVVILKFGEMNLVNGEKENAKIGDITENSEGRFDYIRHARVDGKENTEQAPEIKINPKESRQFSVVFSKPFDLTKDDEAKRTLYFTLPIEMKNTAESLRELKVVFKAVK